MDREEIISKLEMYYNVEEGDYDWKSGCYIGENWLSLEQIVNILSD